MNPGNPIKIEVDFESVFQALKIPFVIIDKNQILQLVNEEFCRISGMKKEQIEGKIRWMQFIHEEDLPGMLETNRLRHQNPQKAPETYEFRFKRADGEIIAAQIILTFFPQSGSLAAVFIDIRPRKDIEDRLQAENQALEEKVRERTWKLLDSNLALADSRERLSEAMQIAKMGIFEWYAKDDRFKISDELYSVLNTRTHSNQVTADWVFAHIESPSQVAVSKSIIRSVISDSVAEKRIRWKSDDGIKIFQVFIRGLTDGSRNLVRLIGMVRDITDQVQLEEQKKEQESLLIHQSKMATMGEMIGAIAHQWKQPLTGISILAQDLEEAWEYGEITKEYISSSVKKILTQIDFMSETINDFRNFLSPAKEIRFFDTESAVRDVLHLLGPQFRSNGVILDDSLLKSNEKLYSFGYSNEFRHVLLIILMNSRDAIRSRKEKSPSDSSFEGKVSLEIHPRGTEKIEICVYDNGGGIPPDFMEYLFVPYKTTKGSKGTGIGLYLSRMILNRMEGNIYLKNTRVGVCARVILKRYYPGEADAVV